MLYLDALDAPEIDGEHKYTHRFKTIRLILASRSARSLKKERIRLHATQIEVQRKCSALAVPVQCSTLMHCTISEVHMLQPHC